MAATAPGTGYAPVNGLEMYYEIHGSGRPLVPLHGALSATETSFGALLPTLAESRQEISVEEQAHGRVLLPMISAFLDAPMPEGA